MKRIVQAVTVALFLISFVGCQREDQVYKNINIFPIKSEGNRYLNDELLALQVRDQKGREVHYDKSIEVGWSQDFETVLTFALPSGIYDDAVTSLNLLFNFWNDGQNNDLFIFYLLDKNDKWIKIRSTQLSYEGEWTYFRESISHPENFIIEGEIQLKVASKSGEGFIDYLGLSLNPSSSYSLPIERKNENGKWFRPWPGMKWGIQYTGDFSELPDVEAFNIDLYETSAEKIQELKENNIYVICYFSGGSSEEWRPDFEDFPDRVQGKGLDGWPGEKWLDVREIEALMEIMGRRMDLAVEKKCDGIDVDNMDGFTNDTGFELSYDDQLAYNKTIAQEAHKRNLGIGLKNDLVQIEDLVDDYDWSVNEQCFKYQECHHLFPFVEKGKPVWGIEYKVDASDFCEESLEWGFDTIQKKLSLDEWVRTCYSNSKN